MADDLLKGFRMGMDLGAPLVQAAMRKRELKMQAERDTIQNLRQARERSLDRAAQQELEDIRQTGMDRRSDAQLKVQGEQLAESTRHNKEMESRADEENNIRRMEAKLRKKEAKRKAKREKDDARPETEKLKEALLNQRIEVADWTKKRDRAARLVRNYELGGFGNGEVSTEEYEAAKARVEEADHNLAAIEDTRRIYASKMDVAMRAGDHGAIDSTIRSTYVEKKNERSFGLIPFPGKYDSWGQQTQPNLIYNPNDNTTWVIPDPTKPVEDPPEDPPGGGLGWTGGGGGNPGGGTPGTLDSTPGKGNSESVGQPGQLGNTMKGKYWEGFQFRK